MIAFARPPEQEIAPGIRIQLCELSDLPPEVQAALPELLNQLEKHYDAADQQRAIVEHKRLRDRGNQDWWLIVDLVLVIVVLFLVNRWLRGI